MVYNVGEKNTTMIWDNQIPISKIAGNLDSWFVRDREEGVRWNFMERRFAFELGMSMKNRNPL